MTKVCTNRQIGDQQPQYKCTQQHYHRQSRKNTQKALADKYADTGTIHYTLIDKHAAQHKESTDPDTGEHHSCKPFQRFLVFHAQ
ncbi:hypothetical protein D9M68_830170 [compost metagenome]